MSHRWAWPRSWSGTSSTSFADINTQGTTVLLVEQNAHIALGVAHRGFVLETGHIVMADDAKALLANEDVKKAYLGE